MKFFSVFLLCLFSLYSYAGADHIVVGDRVIVSTPVRINGQQTGRYIELCDYDLSFAKTPRGTEREYSTYHCHSLVPGSGEKFFSNQELKTLVAIFQEKTRYYVKKNTMLIGGLFTSAFVVATAVTAATAGVTAPMVVATVGGSIVLTGVGTFVGHQQAKMAMADLKNGLLTNSKNYVIADQTFLDLLQDSIEVLIEESSGATPLH